MPPTSSAFSRLQEQIKLVDLVVEVCDARAPLTSRHPNTKEIFGNKPRLLVLTKSDLADPLFKNWLLHFDKELDQKAISLNLKNRQGKDRFLSQILVLTKEKRASLAKKGLLPRPMRLCIVGMPNVGKSSLINWLIGRNHVKTGDRPGITRAPQWVRIHPQIELLDTPGILPNVAFNKKAALKLSLLNLVSESSYDFEETARAGLNLLSDLYPEKIQKYLESPEVPTLDLIAQKRNLIGPGGKKDTKRAATAFLNDLRSGKLGDITLDSLPD